MNDPRMKAMGDSRSAANERSKAHPSRCWMRDRSAGVPWSSGEGYGWLLVLEVP
jgi:hypothetical protein